MRNVSLYFCQGSSDKIYQIALEPNGINSSGFDVTFAYGRRGSTLKTGRKNTFSLTEGEANVMFDALLQEKKQKGYQETEGATSTPYQHAESLSSGILPQLLNPIDEAEALTLLSDDAWCLQRKLDGRNQILRSRNGIPEGINKKGLVVGLPETVLADAIRINQSFTMPGEAIGDDLYVHDLLDLEDNDLRTQPYYTRYLTLEDEIVALGLRHIKLVPVAWTTKEKKAMWKRAKKEKGEGVVFKRCDAPFTPGRPASGGDQRKHKFYATLSAIVASVNAQRSVNLVLFKNGVLTPIGKCTISPNFDVPHVNEVIEVRYLYALKESNCLYQTIMLGVRDDVTADECTFEQQKVKYKPEEI